MITIVSQWCFSMTEIHKIDLTCEWNHYVFMWQIKKHGFDLQNLNVNWWKFIILLKFKSFSCTKKNVLFRTVRGFMKRGFSVMFVLFVCLFVCFYLLNNLYIITSYTSILKGFKGTCTYSYIYSCFYPIFLRRSRVESYIY